MHICNLNLFVTSKTQRKGIEEFGIENLLLTLKVQQQSAKRI